MTPLRPGNSASTRRQNGECKAAIQMKLSRAGMDIAKSVFHVHAVD